MFYCTSIPGDVAELHSDTLRHAPLFRKHASIFFFIVQQLALDPSIAPIDLVEPSNLLNRDSYFF